MYYCQFPNCLYFTNIRSQINYHHIIPSELNGSDKDYNRIYLCPNHHSKVYVPLAKSGIHCVKGKDSIVILGKLSSTIGSIIECVDMNNVYYFIKENKSQNSIIC